VELEHKAPGKAEVAKQPPQRSGALCAKTGAESEDAEASTGLSHEVPKQRFRGEGRVRGGHGVPAQQETIRSACRNQAMQEKAVVAHGEYNLSGPEVFERAAFDFYFITRPKSREHAFTVNA
jgi:hypothetical protein